MEESESEADTVHCEYTITLSACTVDLDVARADLFNLFDGPRLTEEPRK
jgi:hypothetical protein